MTGQGLELTSCSNDASKQQVSTLLSSASMGRNSRAEEAFSDLEMLVRSVASPQADPATLDVLLDKVKGLCQAAETLAVKERENENLTQVLRELSESRAEAIKVKVLTLESYNSLQEEYQRALKSAQLAQAVSRSNCSRANQLRQEAALRKEEVHKAHKQITLLQGCNASLRSENKSLRAELSAVERLTMLSDCHTSASKQQFAHTRSLGLY